MLLFRRFFFVSLFFGTLSILVQLQMAKAEDGKGNLSRLGQVGPYEIKQLVVPGFEKLPRERQAFLYFLSLAIDAGHDIIWKQKSKHGLAIRNLMEVLWEHRALFLPQHQQALIAYFFRLQAEKSNYSKLSNSKFIPEAMDFEDLIMMAEAVNRSVIAKGELLTRNIVEEAKVLRQAIFDMSYQPVLKADRTNLNGKDIIEASGTNFYEDGVTEELVEKADKSIARDPLSYPKLDNWWGGMTPSSPTPPKEVEEKIVIEKHRIGEKFSTELSEVYYFLEIAKVYGTPEEKELISAFQKTLKTGDVKDHEAAHALWAKHRPSDIDFWLDFTENYHDPLGYRPYWEGFLFLIDQDEDGKRLNALIDTHSAYYESNMPVENRFKKARGSKPAASSFARAFYVGGEVYGKPFSGKNLPNEEHIKTKHGSKSYTSLNVLFDEGDVPGDRKEELHLFYLPQYWVYHDMWSEKMTTKIQVTFHERLGHESSKNLPDVTNEDLGDYFNVIEELRAETASLYQMADPLTAKFGFYGKVSEDEAKHLVELTIVRFFTRHIHDYVLLKDDAKNIRQAHRWARQAMLNILMKKNALSVHLSSNAPIVRVESLEKVRESLGELWAYVQLIKSTGDRFRAQQFLEEVDQYTDQHKLWRAKLKETYKNLGKPEEKMYINPTFSAVPTSLKRGGASENPSLARMIFYLGYAKTPAHNARVELIQQNIGRRERLKEGRVLAQRHCNDLATMPEQPAP